MCCKAQLNVYCVFIFALLIINNLGHIIHYRIGKVETRWVSLWSVIMFIVHTQYYNYNVFIPPKYALQVQVQFPIITSLNGY